MQKIFWIILSYMNYHKKKRRENEKYDKKIKCNYDYYIHNIFIIYYRFYHL